MPSARVLHVVSWKGGPSPTTWVEREVDEPGGLAAVGRGLHLGKARDAILLDGAEFTIEVRVLELERRGRLGRRRISMGPIEPVPGHEPDVAGVDARAAASRRI
jgi:hypothetical protein